MRTLTEFTGQNWLITPAALAAGQQPPANIHDQRWLLVLTGVVTANFKGNSGSQFLNDTMAFTPDMAGPGEHGGSGPLTFAIDQFHIPKPSAPPENYIIAFSLVQWAPYASLSAIFDAGSSVNAGFAVNTWRPAPFRKTFSEPGSGGLGNDLITNQPVSNLFSGIRVDVGVRDSDAQILRLGYHITLLGRIVFPVITLG